MAEDVLRGSVARAWWGHRSPSKSATTIPHRSRRRSGMVVTKRMKTISVFRPRVSGRQGPCV